MRYCLFFLLLFGCHPSLKNIPEQRKEPEFFLVLLVDAKHLDYTTAQDVLTTIAKHPNGSKRRDVGHAWILLSGKYNGKKIYIELGHSGEICQEELSYLDGVRELSQNGDHNPIRYLYRTRKDGFLQRGSGGHVPTCAARISLDERTFEEILYYIDPAHYAYTRYNFLEEQCCTFVAKVAQLAGVSLKIHEEIALEQVTESGIRLWSDSTYQVIRVPTPDVLEKSLLESIQKERAVCALTWYKKVYAPFIRG